MFETKYNEALILLDEGKIDFLLIAINGVLRKKPESRWKLSFTILYLDCAEILKTQIERLDEAQLLITKTLQILKKHEGDNEVHPVLLNLNKARAFALRYDINYIKLQLSTNNKNVLDYTNIQSIYDIEEYLCGAIRYYREAIKEWQFDINEEYNIKNNLSLNLARTGRFIESLDYLELNILSQPERWESLASYGDILHTFSKCVYLPSTCSLHLNI